MKLYDHKWDAPILLAQYERFRAEVVEEHLRQPAANARELAKIDEEIAKIKAFIAEHAKP